MNILRIEEFQLTADRRSEIASLLKAGFGVYPVGRSYYKQLPSFRFLAFDEALLVGHMAVEHRILKVGEATLPIFGISDLCVLPSRQQERIATQMLLQLEQLAMENNIEFLLLTGSEPVVYQSLGYVQLERECRWLLISNFQSLGVMRRSINNIMVKSLRGRAWPEGEIDFLGHIF